jgi:prevent-host-death family protein
MNVAPSTDIGPQIGPYLDRLAEGPVIITRDGRPVAALVPVEDEDDAERLSLAYNRRLQRYLQDAKERISRDGGLSEEEFWAAVDARYVDRSRGTGATRKRVTRRRPAE